jgi:orotate phosphoribosyltransferase
MSRHRDTLIELIKERGCEEREDPVTLSGGAETNVYLDIPHVLDSGGRLKLAAAVLIEWIDLHVSDPITAIGAPQTGADALVGAIAVRSQTILKWFTVRKTYKEHGIVGWMQGAQLNDQDVVVLTDDVVSTGHSLMRACDFVEEETGARIAAVIPLVDRAGVAASQFDTRGIPYWPVLTHRDLDLPPLLQSRQEVFGP